MNKSDTTPQMVVGIAGKAGSGKDTIARILNEAFSGKTEIMSFARPVKDALEALDPIIQIDKNEYVRLSGILDSSKPWDTRWDEAKKYPDVRALLQRMGTEVGRNIIDKDLWVNLLRREVLNSPSSLIVVPDMRFETEAECIERFNIGDSHRKSILIHVTRDVAGLDGINSKHASENTDLTYACNIHIENNGSIDDLRTQLKSLIREIREHIDPSSKMPEGFNLEGETVNLSVADLQMGNIIFHEGELILLTKKNTNPIFDGMQVTKGYLPSGDAGGFFLRNIDSVFVLRVTLNEWQLNNSCF